MHVELHGRNLYISMFKQKASRRSKCQNKTWNRRKPGEIDFYFAETSLNFADHGEYRKRNRETKFLVIYCSQLLSLSKEWLVHASQHLALSFQTSFKPWSLFLFESWVSFPLCVMRLARRLSCMSFSYRESPLLYECLVERYFKRGLLCRNLSSSVTCIFLDTLPWL